MHKCLNVILIAAGLCSTGSVFAAKPVAGTVWKEPSTGMEFVYIPAGCFQMGSVEGDIDGDSRERPVHKVCVKAFWLGKYEVTQEQYQTVISSNPSNLKGDKNPVNVSWDETQSFIREMNKGTGRLFFLPYEAQWEYACRAGGQHKTYCGEGFVNALGWSNSNSEKGHHPVGQKQANAWGLHDMSGNVWEWVQDYYHDSYAGAPTDGSVWNSSPYTNAYGGPYRVQRGGSYNERQQLLRAAYRTLDNPAKQYGNVGFRLARTIP